MKTKLIVLAIFMLTTLFISPTQAADCTTGTLKEKYICYRFQTIACTETNIQIDMKDVSMVKKDSGPTSCWMFFSGMGIDVKAECGTAYRNLYWLFMKDGKIHFLHTCDEVKTAWNAYIAFLSDNPEFLNVP